MAQHVLPSSFLAQTVDDHIEWLNLWHRLAFLDLAPRQEQAKKLTAPESFSHWHHSAIQSLPQDQPAIERMIDLFEQLHTLARLVLMRTPDGKQVDRKDYESVVAKHQELMQGLRRLERAFAVAASGLDPLTGLRSRVGLQEDLVREHSRFMRTGKTFCVAAMDVDHFKKINDTYGHDAGDRVLAAVADHISRGLRAFDDAYRTGGEEFLMCLKEADQKIGLMVLERLRAGLEKKPVTLLDGKTIPVTASFGLVTSTQEIAPEDMATMADKALYKAKHEGRNRIVVAS
ncbi:MAG TPA: diguanylate cyclase [Alphaproteobacteria bacterium]|nr:diguanylate cyclase [Alphaproteobacteria bacterium]